MDIKTMIEANRAAWNEVAPLHRQNRWDSLCAGFKQPGFSTLNPMITGILRQFPLDGWNVAQLCCNNGRELISIINMGAGSGVGFDISDEFIDDAEKLAAIAGANCRFVRTDVYDIGWEYQEQFDLIYISVGALTWLPEIERFFTVVSFMLKPGGNLVIYEMHPIACTLSQPGDSSYRQYAPYEPEYAYFREEPITDETGLDYYGKTDYHSHRKFEFIHRFSTILNSMIRNGIELLELNEYPEDISNCFEHLGAQEKLPLSFSLIGMKKS